MQIQAVVSDGSGNYAVEDIDIGDPGPHEVLVDVAASGVCHTDLQLVGDVKVPLVLGHEGAGVVAAVGPETSRGNVGDRVLLTWAIACGACFQCTTGLPV